MKYEKIAEYIRRSKECLLGAVQEAQPIARAFYQRESVFARQGCRLATHRLGFLRPLGQN